MNIVLGERVSSEERRRGANVDTRSVLESLPYEEKRVRKTGEKERERELLF
jgi:hypothetical protein